ncbi:cell wall-binding repeat-containing protein [Herbiconiux liangxiaofengii]|uniref:cell wall-binding repeat-containing protein n=1 Tax=Herbiconiux liangxiaofengii TaxID=3342795 RepID=UPI0035B99467
MNRHDSPARRRALVRAGSLAGAFALSAALLTPAAAHAEGYTVADDSYTVPAGMPFTVAAAQGLFANDLGIDANALLHISTYPAHGDLTRTGADGGFTYVPTDGFAGADSFSYCVKIEVTLPCVTVDAKVSLDVQPSIERIDGADRFAVSAAVSAKKFAEDAAVVYVASGEVFPDALSASAAAGANGAPVLLVRHDGIPTVVADELTRLSPERIVLLGGTATVSAAVETALGGFSGDVDRVEGADRYAVSAAISLDTFGVDRSTVYVASGEVFPDALSGSAAAGLLGGPVLLVQKNAVPTQIAAEIGRLSPDRIVLLGGTATVSTTTEGTLAGLAPVTRVDGADRFKVAARVSKDAFTTPGSHTVYVASGEVFPDALSGSAAAITNGAPVLLVTRDSVPDVTAVELDRLQPSHIVVLGGLNTVSAAVYRELTGHLG